MLILSWNYFLGLGQPEVVQLKERGTGMMEKQLFRFIIAKKHYNMNLFICTLPGPQKKVILI